MFFKKK
jgi:hypothetical protein